MYAIVQAGGRQLKVSPGAVAVLDGTAGEAGAELTFDQVLLVEKDGGEILAGAPFVGVATTAPFVGAVATVGAAFAGGAAALVILSPKIFHTWLAIRRGISFLFTFASNETSTRPSTP